MEPTTTPSQAAIKAGLVTGLILFVINFLCYFINYELLATSWVGILSVVLYCGLIIFFGIQYRKELGGFMSFGTAFQFAFVSLIIMLIITTLGTLLLFLVLDPGLSQRLADLTVKNTLEMMDSFGAGDLPAEQMDEMHRSFVEAYTGWGQIRGAGFLLVFYAILSLILAAIIKKKDKSLDY